MLTLSQICFSINQWDMNCCTSKEPLTKRSQCFPIAVVNLLVFAITLAFVDDRFMEQLAQVGWPKTAAAQRQVADRDV